MAIVTALHNSQVLDYTPNKTNTTLLSSMIRCKNDCCGLCAVVMSNVVKCQRERRIPLYFLNHTLFFCKYGILGFKMSLKSLNYMKLGYFSTSKG